MLTSPYCCAAFRGFAAGVAIVLFGAVHAQPPPGAPSQGVALVTALGPRFQLVERRAPGAVWFSYRRQLIRADGDGADGAALRGLEAARDRRGLRVNRARLALSIERSTLWRWRGTSDSPLANALDQLAAMPERAEWGEILLVVPMLKAQSAGVPPIRRGVGIFVDTVAGSDRYAEPTTRSVHLSVRVWRISARSPAPIASEDVIKSVPIVEGSPASEEAQPHAAAASRLFELIEASVESAALRLLQVQSEAAQGGGVESAASLSLNAQSPVAREQRFPSIEVSARRFTCPALQWRWYDAIASAFEQRHLGSNLFVPTRFDEALHSAAAISREAISQGCLVRITADCAEDRAEEQRAVADSGDSWQERDVPEELQARGVTADFVARQFPYFGHPERCRP
jgi:hypothetical protein